MSSQNSPLPTPTKGPLESRISSDNNSSHRSDLPFVRQLSRSKIRFNKDAGYSKSETLNGDGDITSSATDESAFGMPEYPIEENELRKKEIELMKRYQIVLFHVFTL